MNTKPKQPKKGGRTKGTPNKLSATVKENIEAVFNRLDGTAGMAKWAMENPTPFYQIYSKLLPAKIEGEVNANLTVEIVRFGKNSTSE